MRPATALGDELPPIPDRNWREYVYRQFCLFCHGVQALASRADVQKNVFGFSVPIKEGLIVNCREFIPLKAMPIRLKVEGARQGSIH